MIEPNKIYLSPPHISKKEIKAVTQALKSGWVAPVGSYLNELTKNLKTYYNSNVLITNSGTSAIHLALKSLNIKEDDIILCSNFTFVASAFPILYEKAIPYFIGIEKETWNLSPEFLEEVLFKLKKQNKIPKALILAYCYGMPAQFNKIQQLCNEFEIPIIEDAAESLGSLYNNIPLGSLGTLGVLSFNGNKIITCSTGGALISQNFEYINKSKKRAHQAKEEVDYYLHKEVGYNYAQSNILAAIGVEQLKKLEKRVNKKRFIYDFYKKNLTNIYISTQKEDIHSYPNRWLSSFTFNHANVILKKIEDNNIECRKLWNPLNSQPIFSQYNYCGDKYEDELFANGLSLPSGTQLREHELNRICEIIKSC